MHAFAFFSLRYATAYLLQTDSRVQWNVSVFYLLCKGDSLTSEHLGQKFSTRDQDNDAYSHSCAVTAKGAWWYNDCFHSNLNGHYYHTGNYTSTNRDGVEWYYWKLSIYSLRFTEMKIRPFLVWTEWQHFFLSFSSHKLLLTTMIAVYFRLQIVCILATLSWRAEKWI